MDSVADIARVLLEVALADATGSRLTEKKHDQIRRILYVLAVAAAGESERWSHDLAYPGYVRCDVSGEFMFVPFHLARFFPGEEFLTAVVEAAFLMALETADPVCLSGSATFQNGASCYSDLDFCEYYLSLPVSHSAASVARKIAIKESPVDLAKLRYLNRTYHYPDCLAEGEFQTVFQQQFVKEDEPTAKLDALILSESLGLIPTSNLILLVDPAAPESGAAGRSFAYQEAVITSSSAPPRTLVSSASLGGYLNFLRRQAKAFAVENPIKSLKRALCFFMLVRFTPLVETILQTMRRPSVAFLVAVDRQRTIDELLDRSPPATTARLEPLRPARVPPDGVAYAEAITLPTLRDLATEMFTRIDQLYEGLRGEDS